MKRKIYRLLEVTAIFTYSFLPKFLIKIFDNIFYNFEGSFGYASRSASAKKLFRKCGKNLKISRAVIIKEKEFLEIGDNVSINEYCFISSAGGLIIGNDVLIGHGVSIITSNHKYVDEKLLIREQGLEFSKVIIHDNCWIGARSTILSGVEIFSNSIIAAGAVVTKNVPSRCIVAGIPARVIKNF